MLKSRDAQCSRGIHCFYQLSEAAAAAAAVICPPQATAELKRMYRWAYRAGDNWSLSCLIIVS